MNWLLRRGALFLLIIFCSDVFSMGGRRPPEVDYIPSDAHSLAPQLQCAILMAVASQKYGFSTSPAFTYTPTSREEHLKTVTRLRELLVNLVEKDASLPTVNVLEPLVFSSDKSEALSEVDYRMIFGDLNSLQESPPGLDEDGAPIYYFHNTTEGFIAKYHGGYVIEGEANITFFLEQFIETLRDVMALRDAEGQVVDTQSVSENQLFPFFREVQRLIADQSLSTEKRPEWQLVSTNAWYLPYAPFVNSRVVSALRSQRHVDARYASKGLLFLENHGRRLHIWTTRHVDPFDRDYKKKSWLDIFSLPLG